MFSTNSTLSGNFRAAFALMTTQLGQILEERNQTIFELYTDIAIGWDILKDALQAVI